MWKHFLRKEGSLVKWWKNPDDMPPEDEDEDEEEED
jgi:hypothetical protein